jgi:hypothetical protein
LAFVAPRADVEREVLVVERDLDVPDVERARDVPDVDRAFVVPVERALVVPEVERDFAAVARPPLAPAAFFCAVVPPRLDADFARLVPVVDRDRAEEVDRDFAAVARPPLAPAAFFCAVVPPRLDVDFALVVPVVDRERDVVERDELDVDRDFAAVALPPLRPAAFFCAVVPPRLDVDRDVPVVERLRLVVERDVLREVPVLARDPERVAPEVDRDLVLLVDRRGDAALTRETASSVTVSSPSISPPTRSGIKPGVPTGSGGMLCSPIDSDGLSSSRGSGVRPGSRLSPSK